MVYFSSDWHMSHLNIIKYCSRPFKTVEEMDAKIRENMLSCLQKGDILFYLGDLQMWNKKVTSGLELLRDLKKQGVQIFFIRGNHDKNLKDKELLQYCVKVCDYYEWKAGHGNGGKVVMSHYPLVTWNGRERGAYHVYGHVHSRVRPEWEKHFIYDVGVDRNLFFPVSYDKLKSIIKLRLHLEPA